MTMVDQALDRGAYLIKIDAILHEDMTPPKGPIAHRRWERDSHQVPADSELLCTEPEDLHATMTAAITALQAASDNDDVSDLGNSGLRCARELARRARMGEPRSRRALGLSL